MKRLFLLLLVFGCRDAKPVAVDASMPPCARVGETCEFSPGKLGTCVTPMECTSPPCFVCQSQH